MAGLRVARRGDRRAPHKPLLLLLAVGALVRGRDAIRYAEVADRLEALLLAFAPPVAGRPEPRLPWWHLRSDGLWSIEGDSPIELDAKGFPRKGWLERTRGSLAPAFAERLRRAPGLVQRVVSTLLEDHFPASVHGSLLALTGADRLAPVAGVADVVAGIPVTSVSPPLRRPRDPAFRTAVLEAYGHRCAVTGLGVVLDGVAAACEAAHVRWHAFDGPDDASNGLCLEPTLHALLDRGAWTLSDDRRVLVSSRLGGDDEASVRLRARHGQPISAPAGAPALDVECIRWHREPDRGGVFRWPPVED